MAIYHVMNSLSRLSRSCLASCSAKKQSLLAYQHTRNKYTDHLEALEVVGDVRDVVPRVPIEGLLQALLVQVVADEADRPT